MANKFTKSSSFFNIKVELLKPKLKPVDITDSVDRFHLIYDKRNIFPHIELSINTNTSKLQKYGIGFFAEKYKVTLEIYDNSREKMVDTITMIVKPIRYPGLDLKMISRMVDESNPDANASDIKFSILLINQYTEPLFQAKAFIWEKSVKYKDILKKVMDSMTTWWEFDKPENPNLKFEQFFIPYDRLYNSLAYVVTKGYFTGSNSIGFFITHNGLRLYNLKWTKKRKILKTAIFPAANQIKDLDGVFVIDFAINRQPDLKLKYGTRLQTIGLGHFKGDTVIEGINYEAKHKAFNPNMFEDIPSQQLEYHNFGLKNQVVQNSVYSAFTDINDLQLTINRWSSFEYLIPMRHLFDITFTTNVLSQYSGKYYIITTELIVERNKQEFVPRVNLNLRMIDENTAKKQ